MIETIREFLLRRMVEKTQREFDDYFAHLSAETRFSRAAHIEAIGHKANERYAAVMAALGDE